MEPTESRPMPEIPKPFANQSVTAWIDQLQRAESAEDRLRALQAISILAPKEEAANWSAHSLRDSDSMIRALAAKLLGVIDKPLSPESETEIVSLLVDTDPDTRFEASRALLRRKSARSDQAIPVLLAFLDEDETQPLMVAAILSTLVDHGTGDELNEAVLSPRLQRRLEDERGEVREAVAIAFAKWPEMCKPIADQLLPLLDDSEPVVREKIAEAFGRSGIVNEKIQTALQTASQDEDSEVARVAVEALQRLKTLNHEKR
jgi:vesicle coat complex subunit